MSSVKNRGSVYYSPLRVEADQKEVIISQLKEEVYYLKKNEEEYYLLQDQYRKLEHKYRLLSDEKAISDADFKQRHELALRNICHLKNDLEALKVQLRERNLQLDDLQTDQGTLNSQIDQRLIDIDKLKNQLHSLYADGDQLAVQRSKLQQGIAGIRGDNQSILNGLKNLQINNEGVRRKLDEMQKYLDQLIMEEKILKDKIIAYENENNGIDSKINQIMDDLGVLDQGIHQSQNLIKNLQSQIAEVQAYSDKNKSQAMHFHKATQAQVLKNNDMGKVLTQSEGTLRVRINQVQEGRRQVDSLAQQNHKLNQVNSRLQQDMEYCRRHLQNLALLNSDLVLNLQKFSEQDEVVRTLIDRKKRIERSRAIVDESNDMLQRTTAIKQSPTRISKVKY